MNESDLDFLEELLDTAKELFDQGNKYQEDAFDFVTEEDYEEANFARKRAKQLFEEGKKAMAEFEEECKSFNIDPTNFMDYCEIKG